MSLFRPHWLSIGAALTTLAFVSAFGGCQGDTAGSSHKNISVTGQIVTFETPDGVKIEADWYPAQTSDDQPAPVAILIHMYPVTRASWKPLVPMLRDELGISVLAYDIRGTGGSTEPANRDLKRKYQSGDADHFAKAVNDAIGAYRWLGEQPGADTERLLVIGASVGCSISLQFAAEETEVDGVACLSPGTTYMGIDSVSHIQALGGSTSGEGGTRVLLMAPKAEFANVEKLLNAAGDNDLVRGKQYPGGRQYHGTGMLGAPYGNQVKTRLRDFARDVLDIE